MSSVESSALLIGNCAQPKAQGGDDWNVRFRAESGSSMFSFPASDPTTSNMGKRDSWIRIPRATLAMSGLTLGISTEHVVGY